MTDLESPTGGLPSFDGYLTGEEVHANTMEHKGSYSAKIQGCKKTENVNTRTNRGQLNKTGCLDRKLATRNDVVSIV